MFTEKQVEDVFAVDKDSKVKTTVAELKSHEIFLDEEIGEAKDYREVISLLFKASEHEHFTFYINTPGGNMVTTMAIIEGMKNTQGGVTGVLMGETHSGGSLIAMYCKDLVVLESACMMIHHANVGSYGTARNVKTYSDFTMSWVEKIIDSAYEGFLEKSEIDDVKKGLEIWLDSDEIHKRMQRRVALLEQRAEEEAATEDEPS